MIRQKSAVDQRWLSLCAVGTLDEETGRWAIEFYVNGGGAFSAWWWVGPPYPWRFDERP